MPSTRQLHALPLFVSVIVLSACSGVQPDNLGLHNGKLLPCPDTPNCVSSDEKPSDQVHYIKALNGQWESAQKVLLSQSDIDIISMTDNYIYATSTSLIFHFVDDLELHYRSDNKTIAIRSASRLGHSDIGVNRKRVERIRSLMTAP